MSSTSILSRASKASTAAARVICPLVAVASANAYVYLDYSAGGAYSNSGWFTGTIDHSVAGGMSLPYGFKLFGSMSGTDYMFWEHSDYWDAQAPKGDVTGFAMVWGGRLTGATTYDDMLSAPFEFSTFFENGNVLNDYSSVSGVLTLGYSYDAYTPEQWNGGPVSNASNYQEYYYYADEPGSDDYSDEISVYLEETDAETDLYWFAQLEFHVSHENANYWSWSPDSPGAYASRNGDGFSVTVPENSIDVTFVSENLVAIPEPSMLVSVLGLTALFSVGLRRRRR